MSNPLNFNVEGTEGDENERIKRQKHIGKRDEQQEQERDFEQIVNNNNDVDKDPTAYRNAGPNGYKQRSGQMDQLENLHIGGNETRPQGGNDHESDPGKQQGPGYEVEGTYELDHEANLRTREQKFGDDKLSGPSNPAQD